MPNAGLQIELYTASPLALVCAIVTMITIIVIVQYVNLNPKVSS